MVPDTCSSLLRTGTVVGYAPHHLIVEISAQDNCEQCAQGRGCGMGLLARKRAQQVAVELPETADDVELGLPLHYPQKYPPKYPQKYPLGNLVTISMPRGSVTLLAFFVYGLPLLLALLLSGMASRFYAPIWLAPAVFFITLVCGVISVKYLMRERRERFRPRLVS